MTSTAPSVSALIKLYRAASSTLRRFASTDRQGATAIEFSLLAPVLVAFLLGSVSLFDVVRAMKRVDETAAIVSDLSSRLITIDDAAMTSLYATAEALLQTSIDADAVHVRITSVATRLVDGEEEVEVIWSQSSKDAPRAAADDVDLPMIPLGESVILVEVEHQFTPAFDALPQTSLSLDKSAVRRPRFTNEVIFVDG